MQSATQVMCQKLTENVAAKFTAVFPSVENRLSTSREGMVEEAGWKEKRGNNAVKWAFFVGVHLILLEQSGSAEF